MKNKYNKSTKAIGLLAGIIILFLNISLTGNDRSINVNMDDILKAANAEDCEGSWPSYVDQKCMMNGDCYLSIGSHECW